MRTSKKLALVAIAAVFIYISVSAGAAEKMETWAIGRIMESMAPPKVTAAPLMSPERSSAPSPSPAAAADSAAEKAIPTTISGGLQIKNETGYSVDIPALLKSGPSIKLEKGKPQILIIHTHSSEAYAPAGLDKYDSGGSSRTEDKRLSVIRVGDELAALLTEQGLSVIHDRDIYDYPSYTGSYKRSGAAVQDYLKKYPTIKIVIDLHRDALGAGDEVYKTVADEKGVCASQIMLLTGTDESGLSNPNWRENLKLALYLQNAVSKAHPSLMRPVEIVPQRYNLHLTAGSLILEVGSSGNTLQEALAAVRLFADSAGPALCRLAE